MADQSHRTEPYKSSFVGTPVTLSGGAKITKHIELPLEGFRKGVSAPTETVRGNLAGWLFDADGEILYLTFHVPGEWDGESNLTIVLECLLTAAETANDKIDWETIVTPIGDGEDADSIGTQTPGTEKDIGAVTAAGTRHRCNIILDYDDGTAPIAAEDLVTVALSRTSNVGNAGYVNGVLLLHGAVEFIANCLGEVT